MPLKNNKSFLIDFKSASKKNGQVRVLSSQYCWNVINCIELR
jgi:hypothetical protein